MSNSNRIGKIFEITLSNKFDEYKEKELAFISKVPTDWVAIRGVGGKITTAYPKAKSEFLDYVGVLKDGTFVSFEAKSTNNKTSFPLSSIKEYQFELMEKGLKFTDKIYLIVEFRQHNEIFLLKAIDVLTFKKENDRKSIPYSWFKENAILLNELNILDCIL